MSLKIKLIIGALFVAHGGAIASLGHVFPARDYWVANIFPMAIVAIVVVRGKP